MLKLAKSTNNPETDTELGVSQSTKSFIVNGREALIACAGTISTATHTVKASPDGDNWFSYVADGADGTPATKTITSTQLSAATVIYSFYVYGNGLWFRIDSNDQGTDPDVDYWVSGDVHLND